MNMAQAYYQIKKKIWSFFLLAVFALPLPHDGKLRLYNYHEDQFLEIQYLNSQGEWLQTAYDKLNSFLSSRDSHEMMPIEKKLIELLDHLQDNFGVDTIEIISGYRSPDFNKSLKDDGRDVAENSFHMKGMACDIHIDEIRESTLRDYLLSLKLGGVGYYGNLLMVHADFGPVRTWQGGVFSENTEIGIFNKDNDVKMRTDRLFYDPESTIKFVSKRVPKNLVLERFSHGKWMVASRSVIPAKAGIHESQATLDPRVRGDDSDGAMGYFGKFRYHYESDSTWQNSNEFYIKKK